MASTKMAYQYFIGCYYNDAQNIIHVISIPLRASSQWLRKNLNREILLNSEPLSKSQLEALVKRMPKGAEAGYSKKLLFYLEGSFDGNSRTFF
jgi:hypothetical protein